MRGILTAFSGRDTASATRETGVRLVGLFFFIAVPQSHLTHTHTHSKVDVWLTTHAHPCDK